MTDNIYNNTLYINTIELRLISCKKCFHQWLTKLYHPKYCPKCKSAYWNRDKVDRISQPKKERKTRRYPIQDLLVGQGVIIPWTSDQLTYPSVKRAKAMNQAVRQYQKRSGKKFELSLKASGVLITRRE